MNVFYRPQRNWGCRLHDVVNKGIRTIVLENELLRISILAGKGADLVEFNYKPGDLDFVWLSPGGVRNLRSMHPAHLDPLAAYLDPYPGGWQEVFPSGGEPATHAGASYGQHGEVFALPWDVEIVEDSEDVVAVRFGVRCLKCPGIITKTMRLTSGSPSLEIREAVTNESPVSIDVMWGHHITFGKPFLQPGSRITLPTGLTATPHTVDVAPGGRRVATADAFAWPAGSGANGEPTDFSLVPNPGTPSDLFYLSGFPGQTAWYSIRHPDVGPGFRVEWDAETMPYLWYWQEFGGTTGYPWYGRNFNIGLEPFSSFPSTGLPDAVANGSAMTLAPGETRQFWLHAEVIEPSTADPDAED